MAGRKTFLDYILLTVLAVIYIVPPAASADQFDFAAVSQRITDIFLHYFFHPFEISLIAQHYVQRAGQLFDTNDDGYISLQEVEANDPYSAHLGANGAQIIFDYFDGLPGEKDGVVRVGNLIHEFNFLDKNRDGYLTEAEFREQFPKILEQGARAAGLPVGK